MSSYRKLQYLMTFQGVFCQVKIFSAQWILLIFKVRVNMAILTSMCKASRCQPLSVILAPWCCKLGVSYHFIVINTIINSLIANSFSIYCGLLFFYIVNGCCEMNITWQHIWYHFIKSTVLIQQLLKAEKWIWFIYLEISYTREEQLLQMSGADVFNSVSLHFTAIIILICSIL